MNTYLLMANMSKPSGEGMDRNVYQELANKLIGSGTPVADMWTMRDRPRARGSSSKPNEQVVLMRAGQENPGLIGFGLRCEGEVGNGWRDRLEYPVDFYNLRPLSVQPFVPRDDLKSCSCWPLPYNGQCSGVLLPEDLVLRLDEHLKKVFDTSLSGFCNQFLRRLAIIRPESLQRSPRVPV
jgi:hypothetical protein